MNKITMLLVGIIAISSLMPLVAMQGQLDEQEWIQRLQNRIEFLEDKIKTLEATLAHINQTQNSLYSTIGMLLTTFVPIATYSALLRWNSTP